jgi:hypothetical protein
MSARELLAELDRQNITAYWIQYGADALAPGARIEPIDQVSPELRDALDAHTEMLLKVVTRRPGETPGLYYRPPGAGGAP